MKFREERKRYFESFLARCALHMLVSVLGLGSAYLALIGTNWLPICFFLAATVLLEGLFLYDSLRGWPLASRPREKS